MWNEDAPTGVYILDTCSHFTYNMYIKLKQCSSIIAPLSAIHLFHTHTHIRARHGSDGGTSAETILKWHKHRATDDSTPERANFNKQLLISLRFGFLYYPATLCLAGFLVRLSRAHKIKHLPVLNVMDSNVAAVCMLLFRCYSAHSGTIQFMCCSCVLYICYLRHLTVVFSLEF